MTGIIRNSVAQYSKEDIIMIKASIWKDLSSFTKNTWVQRALTTYSQRGFFIINVIKLFFALLRGDLTPSIIVVFCCESLPSVRNYAGPGQTAWHLSSGQASELRIYWSRETESETQSTQGGRREAVLVSFGQPHFVPLASNWSRATQSVTLLSCSYPWWVSLDCKYIGPCVLVM